MKPTKFTLDISVDCPAAVVRKWWTEFPAEYSAKDPVEPHRVVTSKILPHGKVLATYWHGPDGKEIQIEQVMTLKPDGSWEFDLTHPAGYHVHERFRASEGKGRTLLKVTAEVTPQNAKAEAEIQAQVDWMESRFRRWAKVCERDALSTH